MLDWALNYQEELIKKLRETWMDDRYKWYHAGNFYEDVNINHDTWTAISMFQLETEKS